VSTDPLNGEAVLERPPSPCRARPARPRGEPRNAEHSPLGPGQAVGDVGELVALFANELECRSATEVVDDARAIERPRDDASAPTTSDVSDRSTRPLNRAAATRGQRQRWPAEIAVAVAVLAACTLWLVASHGPGSAEIGASRVRLGAGAALALGRIFPSPRHAAPRSQAPGRDTSRPETSSPARHRAGRRKRDARGPESPRSSRSHRTVDVARPVASPETPRLRVVAPSATTPSNAYGGRSSTAEFLP
jgi:hypothetical protein